MLIDTDVIIWYMRGNKNALKTLSKHKNFKISVITYMELVQGMRNKNELVLLRKFLKSQNVKIINITEEISTKAMFLIERFYLSNSIQIADALIGATAISYGISIMTGNIKHFKIIKQIELNRFKP